MKGLPRGVLEPPKHFSPQVILILAGLGIALLGALDLLLPSAFSLEMLYLAIVVVVAWGAEVRAAVGLACVSAAFLAAHEWRFAPHGPELLPLVWNALSRLTIFGAATWAMVTVIRLSRARDTAIDQSQGRYQAILATAMDGFVSMTREGRITDLNDAFCRMLAYDREELLGTEARHIQTRESPQEFEDHLARIRELGSDRFENRLRQKDGALIDVEVSVSALPGSGGLLIAFTREIAERKQREARLRESEERYRTLAESSPDAIFIVNREGKIQYSNSAAAALWGRTPESLLGVSQTALFGGRQDHIAAAERVFETGEPVRLDESLVFPSGDRWVEARLVPVRAANGQVHSLIVIAVDISERKRTEALLKAQRDLALRLSLTSDLTAALDALLEVAIRLEGVDCGGVYLTDPRTGALDLAAFKGHLSQEFLNRAGHYAGNTDRAQLVLKGEPAYLMYSELPACNGETPEDLRAIGVVPLCHEGVVVGCLNLASHTRDEIPARSRIVMEALAAQTAGAIARVRAETDRHRLEQQILEISDREQARIGQELHDGLCQQLVSLAFDANALREQLAGRNLAEVEVASRIAEYLDQAITEARQLSRGLFPVRLETDGLASALEELARATEARHGVTCTAECDEHLPLPKRTTAVHLYRIAQEAVTNAIKHGRPKNIRIHLGTTAGQLSLEVHDDGSGIEATSPDHHHGMGLHIMDYRARSIGGILQLSRPAGGGTTVSCCISSREFENIGA